MSTAPASPPSQVSAPVPTHSPAAAPTADLSGPGFHLSSYLLGLLTALILLGAMLLLWPRPQQAAIQLQPPPTLAATPEPLRTLLSTATPSPSPLVIFVSGAVALPGLYTLGPGARIGDAIAAAGGLLPGVNPALINQAQPLMDGAQLHVPPPTPLPATAPSAALPAASSPAPPLEASAPASVQEPPAGLSVAAPLSLPTPTAVQANSAAVSERATTVDLSAAADSSNALINVNTAGGAELESLPGIGPTKAQAIIANRPYATIDELDRVPGIGLATLEQIRPHVTTGAP